MFTCVNPESPRVKLFLRYLANASLKQSGYVPRKVTLVKEYKEDPGLIEARMENLTPERKDELETKIQIYYTKNRYLPFELRIKKIRKEITVMNKSKKYKKTKITDLKKKINKCSDILKKIKQHDLPNF